MAARIPDSLERLSHDDLIGAAPDLIHEVTRLGAENEKLVGALGRLRIEHQTVKDELARLKRLPPRPPHKPSGMDKATEAKGPEGGGEKGGRSTQRRGSQLDKLTIGATVVVSAQAPAGSRHKGYEDIVVQDLSLTPTATRYRRERWETPDGETIVVKAQAPAGSRHKGYEEIVVQDLSLKPKVTLYRRERWETPDGETVVAELDPGIVGGYGPHLHRLVLALHFAGQMTCERIVALLNGMDMVISKRQVVRLLTAKLETFRAEDAAVLKAGLGGAYVTVDGAGARHAGKSGYTTQFGSSNFTAFRTGPSKSRLAFLSRLCGGASLWVGRLLRNRLAINDAALDYMKGRDLPQIVIDKFAAHEARIFASTGEWERHVQALALGEAKVLPDPVLIASEAALWGAIHHQGLLQDTVIVSDDAGLPGLDPGIRVGEHALCWVHAERLVHKLIPVNDKQRNAVEVAKRMIWWFYRCLKDYKLAPGFEQTQLLRARFDRIFKRGRTGYATLDSLLKRLHRHKDELLRVLERPEIPLNSRRMRSIRPDQRLGKRHPRLRHQEKNLRRNRQ